ncbi:MAG: FAD-dependent oxidoreductase [Deltaproteobacteria bacterium]
MDEQLRDPEAERVAMEQLQAQLHSIFKNLPHEVPLFLFTQPGKNDLFSAACRFLVRAVREVTPKVTLREYDLKHSMAKNMGVIRAPTLIFDPDRCKIRWLGAPIGEEARTFVEAVLMMGNRSSGLSQESLKVLKKLASPREVKLFVSPSCPYCPQQAVNALKAAIERPDLVSLEIIDIQANPDLADQYSAQSVPQTYANDVLIAQGAQTEELFMLSLDKMEQQTVFIPDSDAQEVETDLVIIGGGPAGLTAGIYAARSGLRSVIIERGALGGQVATTPVVENYPALTQVGGKALVDLMTTHALQYVNIFQGEEVMDIRPGDPIMVLTSRRRFLTKAVLLATGASYRHLGAPGESRLSGHGVSYCSTCDGPLFKGKKVVIVGGGNSAVTEALHLHNIGVQVSIVHRRDALRAQEHLTKNIVANKIPVLFNTETKEIRGKDRVEEVLLYNVKTKETKPMKVDGVFIAIGYTPTVELARKLGLELTPEGFIKRDSHHRTNIPGIYSAGDVEGGYKQIVTAAGQGAEAALAIFEDLVNPYWKSKQAAA